MSVDIQSEFRRDALFDRSLENVLLNTQTLGVLLLDSRLVIRYWNQWLGEWTGMSPADVAQRAFDSLFPALVGSPFARAIDEALFQGVDTHWSQRENPDFLDSTDSIMAGNRRELPLHRVSFTPLELPDVGHCCLVQIDEAPFDATLDKAVLKKEPQRTPASAGQRFSAYLDTDQVPLLLLDSHHLVLDGNEPLEALFGYSIGQLKNRPLRVLLPTISAELADDIKVVLEGRDEREQGAALEGATADGENLVLRVSCFPSVTHRDCHVLLFQDITLQSANLEALFHQRKLINTVFSQVVDGILLTDRHGLVEHLNPIGMELLGINDPQPNRYIDDLMTLLSESGEPVESPCRSALTRGKPVSVVDNAVLSVPGQQPFPVVATATPLRNRLNQVTGTVLVFRSVSEARRISTRLTWQATHDPLTQLANRRHLENEILRSIDVAHADDSTHTLLYIDLYNFSVINDTCGHNAGDELLCQFARLLEKQAESMDVVARIGNDEFALLLNDRTVEESREVAEQLLWQIKAFSFPWEERRLKIGASIGAKVIDRDTVSEIDVLVAAGTSCAAAKESGRNRINFQYRSVEVAERHSLAEWIPVITDALEEDRFVLYCQPIVPVASQDKAAVRHYEVLVRMVDRDGSIILPGKFIPAAEHYGLVEEIDRWVLNNIFAYLEKSAKADQRFAVNLSGNTISDEDLKDYIIGKFEDTGVSPSQLQFEVTETAAIRHFDRAMDLIHALKDLGCYFSLDDFGSGLSSLGYLKELPVDYLKIDGSFIRTMELNEVGYSMVSTINHLGHIMGIATIAECVENSTQLSMLQEIGVDYAQGFLIARPQPLAQLS